MRIVTSSFAALAIATATASAAPILEYKFENMASTGSNSTAIRFTTNNSITPILGTLSSGVTGDLTGSPTFGNDRAYDNSAVTSTTAISGRAETTNLAANGPQDVDDIDGLRSFTVSMWFKAQQSGGRLANDDSFELLSNGGINGAAANPTQFADLNKWYFYAITYDGDLASNNVKIYRGFRNATEAGGAAEVTNVFTTNISGGGTRPTGTFALLIGNRHAGGSDRPFDGWIDNFRIWEAKRTAAAF